MARVLLARERVFVAVNTCLHQLNSLLSLLLLWLIIIVIAIILIIITIVRNYLWDWDPRM
jgi:hypothetical protein